VSTQPPAFVEITPTLQMVADLVRTRLVTEGGYAADTFTSETYPTDAQAGRLIDQAANAVWTQIPGSVAEPWAPAGQHLAALYAAILIEGSYFREQLTDDQIQLYRDLLMQGIRGLGSAIEGGQTAAHLSVDTVLQRSVMTQDPYTMWQLDLPSVPPSGGGA
jgi:hypothetical protein